jgi:para-aminobenzoate synthetase component 1
MITPIIVETWDAPPAPSELLLRLPPAPHRFLLESAQAELWAAEATLRTAEAALRTGGPTDIARYSFLGHQPFMRLKTHGRTITVFDNDAERQWDDDPLETVGMLLGRYAVAPLPTLPPFTSGAVGYFSYDLGRQLESRLPNTAHDDLHLPEIWLAFYDHLFAIDHHLNRGYIIALPLPGREAQAVANARALGQHLRPSPTRPDRFLKPVRSASTLTSNFTRQQYACAVERALDYIGRGHIYQANLSQRFCAPLTQTPEDLYQRLRTVNPAPFAAFIDAGDFQIISASPERFLHFDPQTRRIETRPIKGTRRRGHTPEEDEQLKAELLASEKDKAELVMIVDLERNDLGRVSEYGSVRVTDLRRAEAYPTVWHTVATVEGIARPGLRAPDLLRATFPGGSITGAPKIRAMQIIEELEGLRRHVYCGAIGYLGFDGRLDLNIAIRTLTLKDGHAYFHAGGGLVADSDPDDEYEETLHKGRALAAALGFSI